MFSFHFQGNSVGPTVNPNSIGNELERVQPTIGTGISIMGEKNLGGSSVPKQCYPFGQKHRSTRHYIINCISYLYDTTIREFGDSKFCITKYSVVKFLEDLCIAFWRGKIRNNRKK